MISLCNRRSVLGAVVAVALVGCVHRGGDDTDEKGDTADRDNAEDSTGYVSGINDTDDSGEQTETGKNVENDDGKAPDADEDSDEDEEKDESESPEEMIERLPEPRPMTDPLVQLILADDRETFAEQQDIEYDEGAVQVRVLLESEDKWPKEYFMREISQYGTTVLGFVSIEDLVCLALEDTVRLVELPQDPRPGEPDGMTD